MYLLKSVPAQSHCSKHVEVFFDNLSTIYEEYSSPKSVWQKHLKYHIRLFLPALYILKVIFSTFKSDPSYHSTHTMSLICHASLNAFCLQIHTWLQWPTITPCYNSIQQTPHYWTSLIVLLLYYGVPPYSEIILKKENTWKHCITWVLCINCITWATIVQHLNPLPVYLHITNATWNKSHGKWNWD